MAENFIRAVSFTSFAIIILIFIFVFREAVPIFTSAKQTSTEKDELIQETYGDETSLASEIADEQQNKYEESYGSEDVATVKNLFGKEWRPVSKSPKYGLLPLIMDNF